MSVSVRLLRLRVYNFRNLEPQELDFSPGSNLFSGLNGQGKTNLLEAIYFLGYGRSFRTAKPVECVRHGLAECAVEGTVERGGVEYALRVQISSGDKKLLVHGKTVALDEFVGILHVSAFTGAHLSIVRGGPAERRAFVDRAMVTLFPGHLSHLAAYGRALRQRNRILTTARDNPGGIDKDLLESWDDTLAAEGARIVFDRLRYVERLKTELKGDLFGAEALRIHYAGSLPAAETGLAETEQLFRECLISSRQADRKRGLTSVGPHRDDLKLYSGGKSLADFGSSGQQRSCLLALYFAQMEIHRKEQGFYPVFLVDDAEAELDDLRLGAFLAYLVERTQTFLTTAKGGFLPSPRGPVRRFEVSAGVVTTCQPPGL